VRKSRKKKKTSLGGKSRSERKRGDGEQTGQGLRKEGRARSRIKRWEEKKERKGEREKAKKGIDRKPRKRTSVHCGEGEGELQKESKEREF